MEYNVINTKGLIDFYTKGIEIVPGTFEYKISNIASDIEKLDEEERQCSIMEEMMLEFDKAAGIDSKEIFAADLFPNYDDDEITNWQLKIIKGICHDHFPNVVKSCDEIIENGF